MRCWAQFHVCKPGEMQVELLLFANSKTSGPRFQCNHNNTVYSPQACRTGNEIRSEYPSWSLWKLFHWFTPKCLLLNIVNSSFKKKKNIMSLEKAFCQLRQRRGCGFQWRPAKPTERAGGREFILPTRTCSDGKPLSQQQSESYRHLQQIINTNENYSSWAEGGWPKWKGCQYSTSITSGASASSISQTLLKYKVSCQPNTTAEMPKHQSPLGEQNYQVCTC